jgi:glycosyltransferase involved in cell wall biosynthesis
MLMGFEYENGPSPRKRSLEICRDVAAIRPDVEFFVLGDGPKRSALDALVARFGLADRVRFLRYLPDPADVVKYMRALDVFTLPTEREGFGMVFVEAMATETAVVGPDIPPINGIVMNRETGILVARDDRQVYVNAVLRVRSHFDSRVVFGQIEGTYRWLQTQVAQA